jgi:hypothetical protein
VTASGAAEEIDNHGYKYVIGIMSPTGDFSGGLPTVPVAPITRMRFMQDHPAG